MPEPCSASGEILSGIFAGLFLLSEYIGLSKCKSGSIFEIMFNGFCLKWSITKVKEDDGSVPVLINVEAPVEPVEVKKTVTFEKPIASDPIDI